MSARRLLLSSEAQFRVVGSDQIEVQAPSSPLPISLPLDVCRILLEFSELRSPEDVFERIDGNTTPMEFTSLLQSLETLGLLHAEDGNSNSPLEENESAFTAAFNAGIFDDVQAIADMSQHLAGGGAVVIADALREPFAERLYQSLEGSTRWLPHEAFSPGFHSRHHNLYSEKSFPREVTECLHVFKTAGAKSLIGRLSKTDCRGPVQFGASVYLPGDYTLPHEDFGRERSVAFVLHLTKGWNLDWGGGLFWCPSGAQISPQFNYLTLFKVSSSSVHFVAPVSPYARRRRLAISGWWTKSSVEDESSSEGILDREAPSTLPGVVSGSYGQRARALGRRGRIVAL